MILASSRLAAAFLSISSLLATPVVAHHSSDYQKRSLPHTPSQLSKRSSSVQSKYVFAHVVQGDFQNYQAKDWTSDIALAKAAGIDAFALNVGDLSTDAAEMALAFAAAAADGTFKLFFSFDGTLFNTAAAVANIMPVYLTPYAHSAGYFTYDSKAFVSTFAGDSNGTFFGNTTSLQETAAAWSILISNAAAQSPAIDIFFSPNWNSPADVQYAALSGIQSWSAWPTTDADITTDVDTAYITAAASKNLTYTATVSPFFFVHTATSNNYIYRSDDWLFNTHYEQLINITAGPTFVELLTWNDFGESHYIGPISTDANLPTFSGNYTNSDFDHTPILTMSSYYNSWWKTGTAPTIAQETIFWWYRPHPKVAVATADRLAQPTNADWTDDNFYAAIFLPKKSTATSVIFTSAGTDSSSQTLTAGVNLVKSPFVAGATSIRIVDSKGNTVLSGTGSDIVASPVTYNFNYHSYVVPSKSTPATLISSTKASSGISKVSAPAVFSLIAGSLVAVSVLFV